MSCFQLNTQLKTNKNMYVHVYHLKVDDKLQAIYSIFRSALQINENDSN